MLFEEIDLKDEMAVTEYFQNYYRDTQKHIAPFKLMRPSEIAKILKEIEAGVQITLHAFPGMHTPGHGYAFPRFVRVEKIDKSPDPIFRVTREKSVRDRIPSLMDLASVIEYYYELADLSYLQAQEEAKWAAQWPPERTRPF